MPVTTQALVLDWDSWEWVAGSLEQGFDLDPSQSGPEIAFAFSGNTNRFQPNSATGVQTPSVNQFQEGGFATAPKSLNLAVDFSRDEIIVTTISFAAQNTFAAENVSFSILGVDKNGNNYQDQITSIYGLSPDGVTQIAPTITDLGSSVQVTGSGLNQTILGTANVSESGPGSENGNVTISFGSSAVTSVSFVFASGPDAKNNPGEQNISIQDVSFTPVDEINPVVAASLLCGLAMAGAFRKRRTLRNQAGPRAELDEPDVANEKGLAAATL